jgi:hypothetical protein
MDNTTIKHVHLNINNNKAFTLPDANEHGITMILNSTSIAKHITDMNLV